jgi:4-aminobutyrate aminotransferase
VARSGQGSWVTGSDGSRWLDMTSGIGVTSTGHCHPRVVEAVVAQAGRIVHAQQNVFGAHEPMVLFLSKGF